MKKGNWKACINKTQNYEDMCRSACGYGPPHPLQGRQGWWVSFLGLPDMIWEEVLGDDHPVYWIPGCRGQWGSSSTPHCILNSSCPPHFQPICGQTSPSSNYLSVNSADLFFHSCLLPFSPSNWTLTHLSERQIEEKNEYLIIVYYLLDNSIGTK